MEIAISEQYILNVQAARNLEELWRVFTAAISRRRTLAEAFFEYRAGVLTNRLDRFGDSHPLVRLSVDDVETPESGGLEGAGVFRCDAQADWTVFRLRADNYSSLAEIRFEKDVVPGDAPALEKEAPLSVYGRIFLNQALLLLRLENFEFHAVKDDITLAYNQKHLRAYLATEIERCQRYPSIFSLIFFDLDNLKAVNDKYGHLVGTRVLQDVAEVLRGGIRKTDFLSRFGGDEFVIILLKTDAPKAVEICRRVKDRLERTEFLADRGLNIKMTGSFGVSTFPNDGETVETLIKKADIAMYQIKKSGKNGIKIYQGD